MTDRTSRRIVTFRKPFRLRAVGGEQPAGSYEVETDEELLPTMTATAYRRTATLIFLPSHPGSGGFAHVVEIDPAELEAALAQDGAGESTQASEERPRGEGS